MADEARPAFYAAGPGGWRDWWTILHFPYTVWHLSYVAIGACLAPALDGRRLGATVLAFFFAVGIGAHALDELHGRPLRTRLSDRVLKVAGLVGMVVAVGIGVAGVSEVGYVLIPFLVVGPLLVFGYSTEAFKGRLHTDIGFSAAWGAFPLLTGYLAQAGTIGIGAGLGALAAFGLSYAQRTLSTPARMLRRKAQHVEGALTLTGGSVVTLDGATLRAPLERALLTLSGAMAALAAAMVVVRLA
jgi:hypothetical protein